MAVAVRLNIFFVLYMAHTFCTSIASSFFVSTLYHFRTKLIVCTNSQQSFHSHSLAEVAKQQSKKKKFRQVLLVGFLEQPWVCLWGFFWSRFQNCKTTKTLCLERTSGGLLVPSPAYSMVNNEFRPGLCLGWSRKLQGWRLPSHSGDLVPTCKITVKI